MFYLGHLQIFIACAALVTISHAVFLLLGKQAEKKSPTEREKLWSLHSSINGTLWTLVFLWLVVLQWILPTTPVSPFFRVAGLLLFSIGLLLVGHVRRLLGYERAMGVRFFFPEREQWINSDIYKYLNNPMYDGFVLVLLGAGMMFGIKEDFWLASVSFILLNLFLARIENGPGKNNPL